ncbi:MAG TPA: trigger factor [Opitutaceae bacterium]|nr:trigger factor [Opitutaceae bacterium]
MNIELKDVSETRKSLVVSLDKGEVDSEYQAVVGEIAKVARLPGFRPGRAPAEMVVKRFGKEVQEELKSKVVGRAYRGGLEKTKLEVINIVHVDEGTIEPGLSSAITFTLDVHPQFELPDYVGLPAAVPPTDATDAEIDAVIENLRQDRADFHVAARPARKGDFVKLAYTGAVGGRPIVELVPDKQIYGTVPQTWEEVEGEQAGLIPGLGRQLAGLKAGDKQEVRVTFPPDFAAAPPLAGQAAIYAVEVLEVRERVLPALEAEFFKAQQVESLEALREQVRRNLKLRKEYDNHRAQRQQVSEALAAKIEFPLPESLIAAETQGVLRRFMEDNLRRGVPEAEFEKNKKELYENARRAAVGRVKIQLLLAKVAEKEKIQADERDLDGAILREATRTGQRPDKVAKELAKDRDRLRTLQQAIVFDKALDFLVSKATLTTAAPKT